MPTGYEVKMYSNINEIRMSLQEISETLKQLVELIKDGKDKS